MDLNTVSSVIDIGTTVLSTIGGSAIVAAVMPKPSANAYKIYLIVRKLVDFVGANWFNAKNQ